MSELILSYRNAVAAVRIYAQLVQKMPAAARHALLFLAEDVQDEERETIDCLVTGSAPQLAEVLVNAGQQAPRLACAIVAGSEHLHGVALKCAAGRPWPVSASKPAEQLTPQELAEFDKTGRLPEQKKPRPMPTKEALATAISLRYGGRPVPADEIINVRDFTDEDDTDQTIHFQAWRNAKVDWYEAKVSSAGQIDYTTITQLPF